MLKIKHKEKNLEGSQSKKKHTYKGKTSAKFSSETMQNSNVTSSESQKTKTWQQLCELGKVILAALIVRDLEGKDPAKPSPGCCPTDTGHKYVLFKATAFAGHFLGNNRY